MEQITKILIVDDHQMIIDGIKALLRKETQIQFIGEVADGIEALKFIKNQQPDLLITDISMPNMDGIELTKKVKIIYPEIKILVLSMHDDKQIISEILFAEAEGYILKNTGKLELTTAINKIMQGGTHYSDKVLQIIFQKLQTENKQSLPQLTDRESEILNLIVQEYPNSEIGERLFISVRTVETHRKNIMSKTNSKTVIGLIKYAFHNGIID